MKTTTTAIFFLLMRITISAQPAESPMLNPVAVKTDGVTFLYGTKSTKKEGLVSRQNGDFLRFTGAATVGWIINVASAGAYEMNITYSLKPDSLSTSDISVLFDKGNLTYHVVPTSGVFGAGSYERIPARGSIKLEAGTQSVTLKIPPFVEGQQPLDLRCIELVPV